MSAAMEAVLAYKAPPPPPPLPPLPPPSPPPPPRERPRPACLLACLLVPRACRSPPCTSKQLALPARQHGGANASARSPISWGRPPIRAPPPPAPRCAAGYTYQTGVYLVLSMYTTTRQEFVNASADLTLWEPCANRCVSVAHVVHMWYLACGMWVGTPRAQRRSRAATFGSAQPRGHLRLAPPIPAPQMRRGELVLLVHALPGHVSLLRMLCLRCMWCLCWAALCLSCTPVCGAGAHSPTSVTSSESSRPLACPPAA